MGMAITVPPGLIVLIRDVLGYHPIPHILEIGNQIRLIFYGGNSGRGTDYEQCDCSIINPGLLDILGHLRGYVDSVAVAS